MAAMNMGMVVMGCLIKSYSRLQRCSTYDECTKRYFYCAAPSATVRRSLSPGSVTVMTLAAESASRLETVREKIDIPDTEELPSSSTERDISAGEVVHRSL